MDDTGRVEVLASAPVRIADLGGWTDTWFAERGFVHNAATTQRVYVSVRLDPTAAPRHELDVPELGLAYSYTPGAAPGRHRMIETALAALAPPGALRVRVHETGLPAGAGMGTSSALMVALVAALTEVSSIPRTRAEVAALAQQIESSVQQCGVQDHWAAAFGGVSELTVDYPSVTRDRVRYTLGAQMTLDDLVTVYFGMPHQSGGLHEAVIDTLQQGSGAAVLTRIEAIARSGAQALRDCDHGAYGAALTANHEAIRDLHPDLISDDADALAALAARWGCRGWKVNGAGGPGGSMVVLGIDDWDFRVAFMTELVTVPGWTVLNIEVDHGDLDIPGMDRGGVFAERVAPAPWDQ